MDTSSAGRFGRRDFVARAAALGTASTLGIAARAAAEPPPETKKIRLVKIPALCLAPEYLAEDLLRAEGSTDIEYTELNRTIEHEMLTDDLADMTNPQKLIARGTDWRFLEELKRELKA